MEMKYMIQSKVLEKLSKQIRDGVKLIQQHIEGKHPIIIRHHADADGYCGAIALERAILPLINKQHARERDAWYVYSRRPSVTPYYSYNDANKDLNYFLSDRGKYAYKKPLVIIVDNGSSDQDIMALKKLKVYDVKTIVIDHHPPSKKVDDYTDIHINPNHVGSDYDFCSGMLCSEIANLLNNKSKNLGLIAAVSAFADKVRSKEKDEYFKIANKEGYTDDFIISCADALDYEALSIGFIDARQLMDDFFGKDRGKQKKIIEILKKEVDRRKTLAFNSAKHYMHISKTPKLNIVIVPVGDLRIRGEYPLSGKIVGMIHDFVSKDLKKPTVSLGISDGMINFRGTPDSNLDVNKIIKELLKKFPHAQVDGGGHAKAGSIRFVPAAQEEIKEFVLRKVREM